MKVSLVTVCFNSDTTIKDTIESVLSQSYPDIEYIIIDGASTDKTLDIINAYSDRIHKVVSEPDQGIYDAMNKGIKLATGDVIGILNSDDFYPNQHVIQDVVNQFELDQDADMVLGGVEFVRSDNLSRVIRRYSSVGFLPWHMRFGWMPPHPGSFMKSAVYRQVGYYKLGFKIGADYDFFLRALCVKKLRYRTVNSCWVKMRTGGISTSGLESFKVITREIVLSARECGIYTNSLFVASRVIFKLLQLR
ncbi:glycosyltransferase family 2 protein [Pontibacter sp. JAM-7]|uniref:glycosyltransferase family 2 protein n=1 Tax=Pontibacter sp. JAM-7 TaxID=3366581 RepID=UPI003AF99896